MQTTGPIGGNQVKLFGDDGVSYYYTHLDRFGAAGRVSAGTVIGYVGSTGNAAGGRHARPLRDPPRRRCGGEPVPAYPAVC